MERIKRFLKGEEGVTAIEYGLIAALIALVILVSVTPQYSAGGPILQGAK